MPYIVFTGFEAGSDKGAGQGSGTYSHQTTIKKIGAYALRANPTTTATGFLTLERPNTSGTGSSINLMTAAARHISFDFRYTTKPGSNGEPIISMTGLFGGGDFLRLESDGAIDHWTFPAFGSPSLVTAGTTLLQPDTWYRVEILSTGSPSNSTEVKINGVTEFTSARNFTGWAGGLSLGKSINRSSQTVDLYFDNVTIHDDITNTSVRPAVAIAKAKANGSTQQWTSGTNSSDYNEIKDIPYNIATYVKNSATNQRALFKFEDLSDLNLIGRNILSVKFYTYGYRESASNGSYKLVMRQSSTDYDLTTARTDIGTSTTLQQNGTLAVMDTNPHTGLAWTAADLAAAEFGFYQGNGEIIRIASAFVEILYEDKTYEVANTVDSHLLRRTTRSHTIDSVLRKKIEVSGTFDSLLRATTDISHTADSILRATSVLDYSIDSLIRLQASLSHTTDALIRSISETPYSIDSLLRQSQDLAHSIDALLRREAESSHTIDSMIRREVELSYSIDAALRSQSTVSFTIDSVLEPNLQGTPLGLLLLITRIPPKIRTHTIDALMRFENETLHSIDAALRGRYELDYTVDSILRSRTDLAHSVDALIKYRSELAHTVDALLRHREALAHTIDSVIRTRQEVGHSIDGIIRVRTTLDYTVDSRLRRGGDVIHTIDSVLRAIREKQHSIDALIKFRISLVHSIDSVIKLRADLTTTVDSMLRKKIPANTPDMVGTDRPLVTSETTTTAPEQSLISDVRAHTDVVIERSRAEVRIKKAPESFIEIKAIDIVLIPELVAEGFLESQDQQIQLESSQINIDIEDSENH